MQIEQQDSSRCEALLQPEGALTSDGNAIAPASTSDHAMLPQSGMIFYFIGHSGISLELALGEIEVSICVCY